MMENLRMGEPQDRNNGSSHHVAWADRVGLNKQWSRDVEACSNAYGSPLYHHMVQRFKNNIPNMRGDGPKLYDLLLEHESRLKIEKNNIIREWRKQHPDLAREESFELEFEDRVQTKQDMDLYHFIIQTLEDHGFGFYKSNVDIVEGKMI